MSQFRNSQGLAPQRTARPGLQEHYGNPTAISYATAVPMYPLYVRYLPDPRDPHMYPKMHPPFNPHGPTQTQTLAYPNQQISFRYATPICAGPQAYQRPSINPALSLTRPNLQVRQCPPPPMLRLPPSQLPAPSSAPAPGSRVPTNPSAAVYRPAHDEPAQQSHNTPGPQRRCSAPPTYPAIRVGNAPISRFNRERRQVQVRQMQLPSSCGNGCADASMEDDEEERMQAALTLLHIARGEKRKADDDSDDEVLVKKVKVKGTD